MAITWKITGFEVTPEENGHTNVVKKVEWWCENQTETGTVWAKGTTPLQPSGSSFISFSALTSAEVLGWLDALWIVDHPDRPPEYRDEKDKIVDYVSNSAFETEKVEHRSTPW